MFMTRFTALEGLAPQGGDDRPRTFAPAATHRYPFVVTFSDSGTGGADNTHQAASTTVAHD
jgi:hypothetical protein